MTDEAVPPAAPSVQTAHQAPTSTAVSPDQVLPDTSGYQGLQVGASSPEDARRKFDVRDRKFLLRDQIPAAALLDLALTGDEEAPPLERTRSIKTFLEVAVDPADSFAFNQYLRKASPTIEMDELVKIIEGMIEQISGRPT